MPPSTFSRGRVDNAFEIELSAVKLVGGGAGVAEVPPLAGHLGAMLGSMLGDLLGAGPAGEDASAGHQLVAERVVAIGVRVDQRSDRAGGGDRCTEGVEHFAGVREIEQRVDQQVFTLIDDQSRVAVTPAAVGLQPCVAPVAEVMQALRECATRAWMVVPSFERSGLRKFELADQLALEFGVFVGAAGEVRCHSDI